MPEGSGRPRALARRRELNPYEILQISPQASPEVIKAAYRVLARRAHPDVNAATDSTLRMREINAAFQMLSDPRRRAEYDAVARPVQGQRVRQAQAEARLARAAAPADLGRQRVISATDSGPSSLARIRGVLVALVAVLASIVLVTVIAAWAINDMADDRPDISLFSNGRFSADVQSPVQLFSGKDVSIDQP